MLSPKKVKYRKRQKGKNRGVAYRGSKISFGDYALQVLVPGMITDRQIEAARVAITRHAKRGGQVWICIFPDKPITKKPAEVRMGKGKGSTEQWVAKVKQGRIVFEIAGVEADIAMEALRLGAMKLPLSTRILNRAERGCLE